MKLLIKPFFPFLLPVFFILHQFIRNYRSILASDVVLLIILYWSVALMIAGLAWIFYRDFVKACFISFFLLLYQFFFGYIHDTIKTWAPDSFISQLRFILPLSFLILIALFIWLKKRKHPPAKLNSYLNLLFILLVLIDLVSLCIKIIRPEKITGSKRESFTICDSCKKPDVYFILLDQYAGNKALQEVFQFDNSGFTNELDRRGFHIVKNSSSNYNLTPFSMASIFDMNYLGPEMGTIKHLNVTYSYTVLRNSQALKIFTAHGYKFYNLSVFDFPGQPAHRHSSFFPYGTKLITAQTFTSRMSELIKNDIASGKLPWRKKQAEILYEHLHFNNENFKRLHDIAKEKTGQPKFIYAHFMLPHFPYYFDSKGDPMPIEKLQKFRGTNAADYIEYLQYANGRILTMIDDIFNNSLSPPVIILLSDHGFRHPDKNVDMKYDFMNLNAIYLPDKNYSHFPDSMTNVNFFRILFNSNFGQRLPLVKDSTINLWD